jgi:hypothetical protein
MKRKKNDSPPLRAADGDSHGQRGSDEAAHAPRRVMSADLCSESLDGEENADSWFLNAHVESADSQATPAFTCFQEQRQTASTPIQSNTLDHASQNMIQLDTEYINVSLASFFGFAAKRILLPPMYFCCSDVCVRRPVRQPL